MEARPAAGTVQSPIIPNELFFAKVPPSLTLEVVQEVFTPFGSCQVTLFKRWATARTSKGCGIVTYKDPAAAATALAALHGKHRWPESEVPLVVEMMDQSRQKPAPPKAASSSKQLSQKRSSTDSHSSSSSGSACVPGAVGCRQEQLQRNSLASPLAQQLLPMMWRQQSHGSLPAASAAALAADEDCLMHLGQSSTYVPFCSPSLVPNAQSPGNLDSSWANWESAGTVPVHLLPVTSDIQAYVLRGEVTSSQLDMPSKQQEHAPQSALPLLSLQEAAAAAGLLRGPSFGSGSLPSSEDIRAAVEHLARSTSSMVLSSCHSNAMAAVSMTEPSRTAGASATGLLAQQQLPEGLLQLSDPWLDGNNSMCNNAIIAPAPKQPKHLGSSYSTPRAELFYGAQAVLSGQLSGGSSCSGSSMMLDGATSLGSQHTSATHQVRGGAPPQSTLAWQQDLQQLYQQQQAGLLLQAGATHVVGGSYGSTAPVYGVPAMPTLQLTQEVASSRVTVDVSYALAGKAASTMGTITSMTRAHIEMVAADGGLKLAISGSQEQLSQALQLYCLAFS